MKRHDPSIRRCGRARGTLLALTFVTAAVGWRCATAGWAGGVFGQQGRGGQRSSEPREITPREPLPAAERSGIELFDRVSPSVVHIVTHQRRRARSYFFRSRPQEYPLGQGSGFIWDKRGRIVTNAHVLQGANRAEVILKDQSEWQARLLGYSLDHDLAVLEIDAPEELLSPVAIGTSADLRVGQWVFAIGNPFALDQTLTTGVVSGLGREIQSRSARMIRDVIQTDAAVNPGNSGGPLLDSAGRLIGVNTAIRSNAGDSAGISFAVPVDTVNWVVPQLIRSGGLDVGSGIVPAAEIYARQLGWKKGFLVADVDEDSGAARAGIRPARQFTDGRLSYDVIVSVEGQNVRSFDQMQEILEGRNPGDEVSIQLIRSEAPDEVEDVRIQLGRTEAR